MTKMTRAMLRDMALPEIIIRLYAEPIRPMTIPGVCTIKPKGAWQKYIHDTVIPHTHGFIHTYDENRHLLTHAERKILDIFRQRAEEFERTWRQGEPHYPVLPDGFEKLLAI